MKLTNKAKTVIDKDRRIFNLLAAEFDKSETTIRRWISSDNLLLTTPKAIKILTKELGLKESELFTK